MLHRRPSGGVGVYYGGGGGGRASGSDSEAAEALVQVQLDEVQRQQRTLSEQVRALASMVEGIAEKVGAPKVQPKEAVVGRDSIYGAQTDGKWLAPTSNEAPACQPNQVRARRRAPRGRSSPSSSVGRSEGVVGSPEGETRRRRRREAKSPAQSERGSFRTEGASESGDDDQLSLRL